LLAVAVGLSALAAPTTGVRAGNGSITPGLAAGWQHTEDAWRMHGPLPGVTAAVQLSDGSTWKGVAGAAVIGRHGIPVTADTPFLIASITKTFVAATVLELVHEGKLALSDRLSKWLPFFDRADRISVRMLLAHTSGIADIFDSPAFKTLVLRRPNHIWTFPEILSMVGAPLFEPGTGWDYSNTNYILLGRIIQLVTGRQVSEEIRTRFLDPLGLRDTWFQGEETQGSRTTAALGYARTSTGWRPLAPHDALRPSTSEATFVWTAGAMVSTARDLATWARALYGGHVLEPGSLAQMIDFGRHDYGLGARRTMLGGRQAWGHGGALEGFEASMWYLPSVDASVVVVWNRYPFESDYMADQLATRLIRAVDPDVTPPVVTAPRLAITNSATVIAGHVPVMASWGGHDRQGHIARYQVRIRYGAGAWRPLQLPGSRATSVGLSVRPGSRFTLAVRAADGDGNWSRWLQSQTVQAQIIDSAAPGLALGGSWQEVAQRLAVDGSVERSDQTGSSASLDVHAISVGVVASEGQRRGTASIRLDGGAPANVDLRSPTTRWRRVVFTRTWGVSRSHHVALTVSGAPPRVMVDLDAVLVLEVVPRPR
jgi:D-alanyl-D-alanine carboxypeptidase